MQLTSKRYSNIIKFSRKKEKVLTIIPLPYCHVWGGMDDIPVVLDTAAVQSDGGDGGGGGDNGDDDAY